MPSFRKRPKPICAKGAKGYTLVNRSVGDSEYVSTEIPTSISPLHSPTPSLDELLNAGVSVKEVKCDGILDSYDENDTPIQEMEDKIIENINKSKSKKSKKGDNE